MKKIVLFVSLAIAAITVSCKNDDDLVKTVQLPKSITSTNTNLAFSYSNTGQLIKIENTLSAGQSNEMLFTYDTTGKLTKYVSVNTQPGVVLTETFLVSYPFENQVKVTNEANDYTLINLNENGQAVSLVKSNKTTTFLYDTNGNLVKNENENNTITANFNTYKGVFSGVTSPKWVLLLTAYNLHNFAVNNPVTVTNVTVENNVTTTSSETYSYPIEHIVNEYPTKISVNYSVNGTSNNYVYTVHY